MILTVTLNPLLEHRLTYPSVKVGGENRISKEEYKAGGKGINVSRQLNLLSLDNIAYTFLGGFNGKRIKNLLIEEKINFTSISTKSETRQSAIVIDESNKSVTSCFGNNALVTSSEVDEFKLKLEKMIQNCEMVIFSGSSPCDEADSIIPFGIAAANRYDKISICDTYGGHLQKCLENSPTIVHNNVDEIEKSFVCSLKTEEEKVDFLMKLHSLGVKQSFITNGAEPSYCSNLDYHYKVIIPKVETIDSTGSGDSFTAGIAYGWHNNLPFEASLAFASALGVVNAQRYEVCQISSNEARQVENRIQIQPIGKKMRLVDVKSS